MIERSGIRHEKFSGNFDFANLQGFSFLMTDFAPLVLLCNKYKFKINKYFKLKSKLLL